MLYARPEYIHILSLKYVDRHKRIPTIIKPAFGEHFGDPNLEFRKGVGLVRVKKISERRKY